VHSWQQSSLKDSQIRYQLTEYIRIRNGGVGERLKPAVLKNEIADSLSGQKIQLDPFASRKIATISVFWICSDFVRFAPVLVTVR
jgi:hypothetical protein